MIPCQHEMATDEIPRKNIERESSERKLHVSVHWRAQCHTKWSTLVTKDSESCHWCQISFPSFVLLHQNGLYCSIGIFSRTGRWFRSVACTGFDWQHCICSFALSLFKESETIEWLQDWAKRWALLWTAIESETPSVCARPSYPSCAGALPQELCHWIRSQNLRSSSGIAFGSDCQMTSRGSNLDSTWTLPPDQWVVMVLFAIKPQNKVQKSVWSLNSF